MQDTPDNSIKVAIRNLGVGMFVAAIETNKRVNLAHAGRVSTAIAIQRLRDNHVKYVWVDPQLSSNRCKIIPVIESSLKSSTSKQPKSSDSTPSKPILCEPTSGKQTQLEKIKKITPISRSLQQEQAQLLISEAKLLAQKLLSNTFDAKEFNLGVMDQLAEDMIESILIDSDAIASVSAMRHKNVYLLEHSIHVACLMLSFGKYLELDRDALKQMTIGGILHDIGKIKIKDEVLFKPGKLTTPEFEHIKLHPVYAEEMLNDIYGLGQVSRDVCLMHHEKLDGTGYPKGLTQDQIPLHARMVCIVDIYDALTSDRCYKKGISSAEAFKILLSLTPFHLDTELVYKFINCIGVYPVGSIVKLNDGRLGIVWISNKTSPLKPAVKCFYSRKYKRFTDVKVVDLKNSTRYKIEKAVAPSSLEVDPTPFYS